MLKFLATVTEELDSVGASEAADIRTLTYYLEDEAKDVHEAQISDVDEDFDGEKYPPDTMCTWTFVIDALFWRFMTEEVLQEAHD